MGFRALGMLLTALSGERMENDFRQFLDLLVGACARIDHEYFQLSQAGADAVYRERVYCYELYHQLRTSWGQFPYSLGGEVDKAGHPLLRDGPYPRSKPDLLVHVPGDMGQNLAVVEVKPATAALADLLSDIDKLSWFCGKPAEYYCGILLVYGAQFEFRGARDELSDAVHARADVRLLLMEHLRQGLPSEVIAATDVDP
jgi:hypothetical protein